MQYSSHYPSPLGEILLTADDTGLTGLWFETQRYLAPFLKDGLTEKELPLFRLTKQWLDLYFSGKEPDFTPPLHPIGSEFRQAVWKILCSIPYGHTLTYGEIARRLAAGRGMAHMSAQAVGGAVGHNNISIIIPCHRVVGAGGNLTGFGGGIDRKVKLLTLEGVDMSAFFIPKKGTAL